MNARDGTTMVIGFAFGRAMALNDWAQAAILLGIFLMRLRETE